MNCSQWLRPTAAILFVAVFSLLSLGVTNVGDAQTPPPGPASYGWFGEFIGEVGGPTSGPWSGSGSAATLGHMVGRKTIETIDAETGEIKITLFPIVAGDSVSFTTVDQFFKPFDVQRTVALSGLPDLSSATFSLKNARFFGGPLVADEINISNQFRISPAESTTSQQTFDLVDLSAINISIYPSDENNLSPDPDVDLSFISGGLVASEELRILSGNGNMLFQDNTFSADKLVVNEFPFGGSRTATLDWQIKNTQGTVQHDVQLSSGEISQVKLDIEGSQTELNLAEVGGASILGVKGDADIKIHGGATVNTHETIVGLEEESEIKIEIDSAKWEVGNASLGVFGKAEITAKNGAELIGKDVSLGFQKSNSDHKSTATLLDDSKWTLNGTFQIGQTGRGKLEIKDESSVEVNGQVSLATNEDSHGEVLVESDKMFKSTSFFEVGRSGKALLTLQDGGVVKAEDDAFVGTFQTGDGTVKISGENSMFLADGHFNLGNGLSAGPINGQNGKGLLILEQGGQLRIAEGKELRVGRREGSMGELRIFDGGATTTGSLVVGGLGEGRVEIGTDGRLEITGDRAVIGDQSTGVGEVRLTASTAVLTTPSAELTVGREGVGRLEITSGATHQTAGNDIVGEEEDGQGTVLVDGEGSTWRVNGSPQVGKAGEGTVEIRDAGSATAVNAFLGYDPTGIGKATVSGAESHWSMSDAIIIGHQGTGSLTIEEGGRVTADQEGIVAALEESRGMVEVRGEGSQWLLGDDLIVGQRGEGTLLIADGGRVDVEAQIAVGLHEGATGEIILDGPQSSLTSSNNLVLAGEGDGRLEVINGAQLTLQEVMIGQAETPEIQGELTVQGSGSTAETTGDFTLGGKSKGLLRIEDGGSLTTTGSVMLSQETDSESDVTVCSDDEQATWTIDGDASVGAKGLARVMVKKAAAVEVAGDLTLGEDEKGRAILEIDGEFASVTARGLRVGDVGRGEIMVRGGAQLIATNAVISSFNPPDEIGLHGAVHVIDPGSKFEVGEDLIVGLEQQQKGEVFVKMGGIVTTEGNAILARDRGSFGDFNINGESPTPTPAKWSLGGDLTIGQGGQSFLDVVFGGQFEGAEGTDILLGEKEGSDGVLNIRGSDMAQPTAATHGGNLRVGVGGSGSLRISSNASLHTGGDVILAENVGSEARVRVHEDDTKWEVAGKLEMGMGSNASLVVEDMAEMTVGKELTIEGGQGSRRIRVSDGGKLTVKTFEVERFAEIDITGTDSLFSAIDASIGGNAMMSISNGAIFEIRDQTSPTPGIDVREDGVLSVQGAPGATATVSMSGAADTFGVSGLAEFGNHSLFDNSATRVYVAPEGELNLFGDQSRFIAQRLDVRDESILTINGVREFGTLSGLNVTGGWALLQNMTDNGVGVTVSGGVGGGGASGRLVIAGQTTTGPGVIGSGSTGKATLNAGATWTVGNANAAGQLDIGASNRFGTLGTGFLLLNSGSTVHVLGDIHVSPGSAFGGTGVIIANNFRNDGKALPGQSPGVLTIDANYTQSETGSLELEIGGLTAGTQHDQIVFLRNVDLAGDVILKFIDGFAPATDDVFSLLMTDPSMQFEWNPDSIQIAGLAPGFEYAIEATDQGFGIQALNDGVSMVPEPGALLLLLSAAAFCPRIRTPRRNARIGMSMQ